MLLVSCGPSDTSQSGENTSSEIAHHYSESYEKDESGHWKICTVEGHSDKTEKEAHKYGEWKVLSEADVHKDKVEHRHCSVCDCEEKRTVSNSGTHTYVLKNDDTKHWYESTCDHDTPLIKDEEKHTFSEWKTLTEASLHTDKVEHRLCTVCNYEEKRTVNNTGTHSFDTTVWKYDNNSHWHESNCGHSPALKADVAAHVMSEWKEKTPASYLANRIDERKCTICDYSETKVVDGTMIPKIVRDLVLKPIANRVFDGLAKPVLESDLTFTNKEGGLIIEYREKGKEEYSSTNIPREAGSYEYRVTLNETEMYAKVQKSGEFVVDKLRLDLPNKTLFEVDPSNLIIHDFDVSALSNQYTDYVSIKVPEIYKKPGKYDVPTSMLYLNDDNFTLNVGSTTLIKVVNYDTKEFIAYISDTAQQITGTSHFEVPIKISQGTLENASSIWFYGYGDWLYVREMKQGGVSITKATVGEELSLIVNGPVDLSKLAKGTLLSTKSNVSTYQSAFATLQVYSLEEGGITDHSFGFERKLYFEDTLTEHNVRVFYPNTWSNPGSTQEGVRIDFSSSIINYIDRPFKLKTFDGVTTFAEGVISLVHNHSESILSTGKCEECAFNNSAVLTFAEGSSEAKSLVYGYFTNEVRVFYLTLTRSRNYASKYTFSMDNTAGSSLDNDYSIELFDAMSGVKLNLLNNVYQLSSGSTNLNVRVVIKFNRETIGVSHSQLIVIRIYRIE